MVNSNLGLTTFLHIQQTQQWNEWVFTGSLTILSRFELITRSSSRQKLTDLVASYSKETEVSGKLSMLSYNSMHQPFTHIWAAALLILNCTSLSVTQDWVSQGTQLFTQCSTCSRLTRVSCLAYSPHSREVLKALSFSLSFGAKLTRWAKACSDWLVSTRLPGMKHEVNSANALRFVWGIIFGTFRTQLSQMTRCIAVSWCACVSLFVCVCVCVWHVKFLFIYRVF